MDPAFELIHINEKLLDLYSSPSLPKLVQNKSAMANFPGTYVQLADGDRS
jgi:hypothetical protein